MLLKYDDDVLKQLQKVELEMLKEFDRVCTKYDIQYFLSFGSLIGAVRHKGFIPWDDDIDVCMLREDYERLCKVPKDEWQNDLYLVKPTDDIASNCEIYPRIFKKGTVFEPQLFNEKYISRDKNYKPREIWMDIFIYDRVQNKEVEKNKVKAKKMYRLLRLYLYAKYKTKIQSDASLLNKLRCLFKLLLHYILNIVSRPEVRIYNKYVKFAKKDSKNAKYVMTFESSKMNENLNSIVGYNDIYPVVRVPFEDITACIPKNYDKVLRKMFGDYMKMPPVESRYNHPPLILDFGDGRGNVIKDSDI